MSRHQGSSGKGKSSGRGQLAKGNKSFSRGGDRPKESYSRGNAPMRKRQTPIEKPKTDNNAPSIKSNPDEMRLNKYIANSGLCSRREADMHIAIGSVTVNGTVVTEMGYKVKKTDEVKFDGSKVTPEKKMYVLLNKPKGYATTASEGKGRTVMDLVANVGSTSIRPIGRLGRGSLGLILFTNDEAIVKKFTSSKTGVPRLFHIELETNLKLGDLKKIQAGLYIDDKTVSVDEISYVEGKDKNQIGLKLRNIGNSTIRSIFEHLGYEIVTLDCVAIGELTKKDLPRGRWRHLSQQEVNNLKMLA